MAGDDKSALIRDTKEELTLHFHTALTFNPSWIEARYQLKRKDESNTRLHAPPSLQGQKSPCKTLRADFFHRNHQQSRVDLPRLAESRRIRSFSAAKMKYGDASRHRTPNKTERVKDTEKKQKENRDEKERESLRRWALTYRTRVRPPNGGAKRDLKVEFLVREEKDERESLFSQRLVFICSSF